MTYQDPNDLPPTTPVYTETVETVVVRERNNTATWWIAGLIALAAIIVIGWMVTANSDDSTAEADAALRAAELQVAADQARLQAEVSGAQQSVDFARADAMRASAEASRATMDARAAEARANAAASQPPATVIIREPAPVPVVVQPTVTPPAN